VQFHPEVAHTPRGEELISNFVFRICGCEPTWTPGSFIDTEIERIREQVGDAHAVCGLSGGVDSSVAATLVHRAIGDRLTCIFVDTGLLRAHERESVERTFRRHMGMHLEVVDAADLFLDRLEGVEDPERKRKIIGNGSSTCSRSGGARWGRRPLPGAGHALPGRDRVASRCGALRDIKTHHNVGGLPRR
jgi:GMP synthase (glutamine-hydrolysing)